MPLLISNKTFFLGHMQLLDVPGDLPHHHPHKLCYNIHFCQVLIILLVGRADINLVHLNCIEQITADSALVSIFPQHCILNIQII